MLQDALALTLELRADLLVVARPAGDLFPLLLDRTIDRIEPRPFVEQEPLCPLRLELPRSRARALQRVFSAIRPRDFTLAASVAFFLLLASLRASASSRAAGCKLRR